MRLEARGLDFGYPGKPVGRGVSLTVGPGEVLCLLGPNGAGKTTLFRTLLGLVPPQGGLMLLDGKPFSSWSRPAIARRIAYVPQAQAMAFAHTVQDIVLMGRTAHLGPFARPGPRDLATARDAMGMMGIINLADSDYINLSGGQRQSALIARALAQAAPLLVMDEPTASLDFGNQALVLQHIARLRASGLGIVLSTHHPEHAFDCATAVALLHDGTLQAQGTPEAALTPDNLTAVYGVPVRLERLAGGRTVCVAGSGDGTGGSLSGSDISRASFR